MAATGLPGRNRSGRSWFASCASGGLSVFRRVLALTGVALYAFVPSAAAQTCGQDYRIVEGDTLGAIAARTYGDPNQWTIIFYANQDRISDDGMLIRPGLELRLPCIGRSLQSRTPAVTAPTSPPAQAAAQSPAPPTVAAEQPVDRTSPSGQADQILISSLLRQVQLLTADGYTPFTGRTLENGGMITELLSKSMSMVKSESNGRFDYSISWVNDWAAHLSPLLISRAFDLGFPYSKPDCTELAVLDRIDRLKCERFFFSDPLFEVATLLYTRVDSSIKTLSSADVQGTTVCRPVGWSMQEFDQGGRNWIRDSIVVVVRPPSFDACFQLLAEGRVDSVAADELTARSSIALLGLDDVVNPLDAPLSFSTLHAMVTRTHPHARTILYYTNEGLRRLRQTREYDQIVDKHLSDFWSSLKTVPNAAIATQRAVEQPRAATAVQGPAPASEPAAASQPAEPVRGNN